MASSTLKPYYFPDLIVLHRTFRFLILSLFIVLQAMAPFIHAHAGAGQLSHTGFLHQHQDAPHDGDARHAIAADEHGAEVAVAAGMPLRNAMPGEPVDAPFALISTPLRFDVMPRPGAGQPAPPLQRIALPDHTLPHALAPPAA